MDTPSASPADQIRDHATNLGYWDIAARAGWNRVVADRLLDLALLLRDDTGSSAAPAAIAVAWLRPEPEAGDR